MKLFLVILTTFFFLGGCDLNEDGEETPTEEATTEEATAEETTAEETASTDESAESTDAGTPDLIVTSWTCESSGVSLEVERYAGTCSSEGSSPPCCGLYQIHEDGSRELISSSTLSNAQCNAFNSMLTIRRPLTALYVPNEEHRTIHGTGCTRN